MNSPDAAPLVMSKTLKYIYSMSLIAISFSASAMGSGAGKLEVVTRDMDSSIADGAIVFAYTGPVVHPMRQEIEEAWVRHRGTVSKVILDLNSPGGSNTHGVEVIRLLEEIRGSVSLVTAVRNGALCASMCIPIFMQGDSRVASPASAWMFHGSSHAFSNVPVPLPTLSYLALLKDRGASEVFLRSLEERRYVLDPGQFWLSGHELSEVHKAGIITRLLPSWQPQEPRNPPFDPMLLGPR
jgi:hypothetical protein